MGASLFIINHTRGEIIFCGSSSLYSDGLKIFLPFYLGLINSNTWSQSDNIEIDNKCNLDYHDKDGNYKFDHKIAENDTYFTCELDECDGCTCGIKNYQVIKIIK